MTKTRSKFMNNIKTFHETMRGKFEEKLKRADAKISTIKEQIEEETSNKRNMKYHNIEKVKKKNEELHSTRRRELELKNQQIDNHIEKAKKMQEHQKEMKLKEGEENERRRKEVKAKVDQEFQEKVAKTNAKLEKIDLKAQNYKEKKERERLVAIELEAIKRREREQEAHRIQRAEEYRRQQQAHEKEKQHMKSTYLMTKRAEVKELRKTVRANANLYKEKVKQEIENLKRRKGKLDPESINIDLDPNSPDLVKITNAASKFLIINPYRTCEKDSRYRKCEDKR